MFMHVLRAEALTAFVLDDLLKDVCTALEDSNRVSLQSNGHACLLAFIEDLGSQSLEFLFHNATHSFSLHCPMGSGA